MKTLIFLGIVIILAAITNPQKEDHIGAVKQLYSNSVNKEIVKGFDSKNKWEAAGTAIGYTLGMNLIDKIAESIITSRSFIIFSLTEVSFNGQSRIIGLGAFGNVWIFGDVKML